MTRHHGESIIYILLKRNLAFDSGVRQWKRSFDDPIALFLGLNQTIGRVVNLSVEWLGFVFVSVYLAFVLISVFDLLFHCLLEKVREASLKLEVFRVEKFWT